MFYSKETLDDHLAHDATRVFLWFKTLTREKITAQWARLPVGRLIARLVALVRRDIISRVHRHLALRAPDARVVARDRGVVESPCMVALVLE